jgi:hypothetical protein
MPSVSAGRQIINLVVDNAMPQSNANPCVQTQTTSADASEFNRIVTAPPA